MMLRWQALKMAERSHLWHPPPASARQRQLLMPSSGWPAQHKPGLSACIGIQFGCSLCRYYPSRLHGHVLQALAQVMASDLPQQRKPDVSACNGCLLGKGWTGCMHTLCRLLTSDLASGACLHSPGLVWQLACDITCCIGHKLAELHALTEGCSLR